MGIVPLIKCVLEVLSFLLIVKLIIKLSPVINNVKVKPVEATRR